MAKNKVIAGDYLNASVKVSFGTVMVSRITPSIVSLALNKSNVESYDVITEDIRKSASSGIMRGAVGAALLGPVGLLAGVSAKNKGVHTVAIKWKSGKNSLLEVDEKIYKAIIKAVF